MSVMSHVWNVVIYLSTVEPRSTMRNGDWEIGESGVRSGVEQSRAEQNKNNKNKNKGKMRYHHRQ